MFSFSFSFSFSLSLFLLISLSHSLLSLSKKKKKKKTVRWKDFTFDPVNYPEKAVRAFVDSLHSQGRRFVPILDPGIKLEPGYAPYDDAVASNLFLKDVTGDFYIGEVWPGACHIPDFLNPASLDWWAKHVGEFWEKVPFDGLWIDMNEVRKMERRGGGFEAYFFFTSRSSSKLTFFPLSSFSTSTSPLIIIIIFAKKPFSP